MLTTAHPNHRETALRRRLRMAHLARMAVEHAHGVRIRPITDEAIRALASGGPERQAGQISDQDQAALAMYLPDLLAELLDHRHQARLRAAKAAAEPKGGDA